jgi:predicted helicase
VLSRVVLKKRASANSAERAAWQADDLLFVSSYGEGDERQISFAHFSQHGKEADLPTLKVLGWDNRDTPLHLDQVADALRQRLVWPENEQDAKRWREKWRSAFTLQHLEVINTSKALATRLADLARAIRDRIKTVLAIETENGPVTKLMQAFQQALIHDLTADDFADMYAQTIAYGLLSARVAHPRHDNAEAVATQIPVTNPFLKELMETFLHLGGRKRRARGGGGIDFDELGVSEVVELLDAANMEAVVRDFGARTRDEDPVIHFYELFLKEYDAKKRMQRGVFYTPQPVVSYIVRSVHKLLQTEFGLEDGLASTVTWGEMTKNAGLKIPEGVNPTEPFVRILDPATGTATFLVEVVDVIYRTLAAKWKQHGLTDAQRVAKWNEYVPKHLLPRLYGYELMMAPYAIAHTKIGLKLYETGYHFGSDERARIYLTNTLEPASDDTKQMTFAGWAPALANEAQAVNAIKRHERFTVVIGNPPYANYSANLSPQARRIVDKYRTFQGIPIRERNQLQFERNIQDDFVKFISIGEDYIQTATIGVLSYITNATMLASTSLRGLREHLTQGFSALFELNLHGGVNEIGADAEDDENVFDIAQDVAIHVYVRSMSSRSQAVNFADLMGRRSAKYAALADQTVATTEWLPVKPDPENCSFLPRDEATRGTTRRLDSAFVQFGAGIKTNRDAVVIGFDDNSLVKAVREFNPQLVADKDHRRRIHLLLYRPFDIRRIFYQANAIASRSLPTMKHFVAGPNIGLVASSTWTTPERFSVNVSRSMIEMKTGTHDRGTTLFPLYRYEGLLGEKTVRVHNLTQEFVNEWGAITRTRFAPVGHGDLETTSGPEDVLFWLYAMFYSPE